MSSQAQPSDGDTRDRVTVASKEEVDMRSASTFLRDSVVGDARVRWSASIFTCSMTHMFNRS